MAKPVIPWENYNLRTYVGVSSMGVTLEYFAGTDVNGDPIFKHKSFSINNSMYIVIEQLKGVLPELSGWDWNIALDNMAWSLMQFINSELGSGTHTNKIGTDWNLARVSENNKKGGVIIDRELERKFFEKIRQ